MATQRRIESWCCNKNAYLLPSAAISVQQHHSASGCQDDLNNTEVGKIIGHYARLPKRSEYGTGGRFPVLNGPCARCMIVALLHHHCMSPIQGVDPLCISVLDPSSKLKIIPSSRPPLATRPLCMINGPCAGQF